MADKRKRIRKPGTIGTLRKKIWQSILTAEELLLSDDVDIDQRIRAIHAITQAGNTYNRILETSELEARLNELEQIIEDQT